MQKCAVTTHAHNKIYFVIQLITLSRKNEEETLRCYLQVQEELEIYFRETSISLVNKDLTINHLKTNKQTNKQRRLKQINHFHKPPQIHFHLVESCDS